MILLLAFDVPGEIKNKLKATCAPLQGIAENTEWNTVDQMHIPVAYIGDVPASFLHHVRDAIGRAMADVQQAEFRARGLGFFGSRRYMSSVWCGIQPEDDLKALHEHLWDYLRKLGYRPSHGEAFFPRINLAFCKGRTRNEKLVDALAPHENELFGTWTPSALSLMEQMKGPKGPRYKTLQRFLLQYPA